MKTDEKMQTYPSISGGSRQSQKDQIKELYMESGGDTQDREEIHKKHREWYGIDSAFPTNEQLDGVLGIGASGVQYEYSSHPLLNADSSHYEMVGGMEAIEIMESIFTVDELKAWAKLTAMKYRLRIGKKDDPTKEIKKIKTFEDYYRYLYTLPNGS